MIERYIELKLINGFFNIYDNNRLIKLVSYMIPFGKNSINYPEKQLKCILYDTKRYVI
jgi:hypothetical protein